MNKEAVILTHVPFEGPGLFEQELIRHGLKPKPYLVPEQGLPDTPGAFVLAMGGPMSVNDPALWIERERRFIRSAVEAGTPYLGICLGCQLLAGAFGGRVVPGPCFEAGLHEVKLTAKGRIDPLFQGWPADLQVFQWHGEAIEAPDGAVVLAESEHFPVQAFRVGQKAYGLLFHLEMDEAGVQTLCKHCPDDLERAGLSPEDVAASAAPRLNHLQSLARKLITALLQR